MQHLAGIAHALGLVGTGVGKRFVEGVKHQLVHGLAVAKADFGFGGVHIGVDIFGRQIEKQHKSGRERLVQHIAVGLFHRMHHHFVAHETAVDKAILLAAFALGKRGFGNHAA